MRGLQVAVIVMGVLIVAGVAVLGVTIARRTLGGAAHVATALLDEPAGTRIVAANGAVERLVVQLSGGGADRVVVIDLRDGQTLGRVALAR